MENKSIFDFDKTLIRINSFPFWILFLMFYSLLKFRFPLFVKLFQLLWNRKIRKKIKHVDFKHELVKLTQNMDCHSRFGIILSLFIRKKVGQKLVELHTNGHRIAVTSAAPEIYLKPFVEKTFPDFEIQIFGSKINENEIWEENFGANKLNAAIRSRFLGQKEKFRNLFTDSWDDFELAGMAEKITLVYPKNADKKRFLENPELKNKVEIF